MISGSEYLLVDGYNIIYSWDELKSFASDSLDIARHRLIEILSDYQGYKNIHIIVVFDAYKQKNNAVTFQTHDNIKVVYTKSSQSADTYIERFSAMYSKNNKITVATSDYLEQIIIISKGAARISAKDLFIDILATKDKLKKKYTSPSYIKNNTLIDNLDTKTKEILQKMLLKNENR